MADRAKWRYPTKRISRRVWLELFACAALAACANGVDETDQAIDGGSVDGGTAEDAAKDPTVVVLPDTQYYACGYPRIFEAQTRFIVKQVQKRDLRIVLHTGDVVDFDEDSQWQVAYKSMHRLDGVVPYLITSGNHDLWVDRESKMVDFFNTGLLDAFDDEAEAYQPPRVDSAYAVVSIAGQRWLFMGLEFGPRDAIVAWADGVLKAHAELPAVLFAHVYLYSDGCRYDRNLSPPQPYHPDEYGLTPEQGINDGEDLWRKLVEPNENVRLVLSGHVFPDGVARSTAIRASGTAVHQVLANYQHCEICPCAEVEGGGGYLRLLTFLFSDNAPHIRVSTYSPYYDQWLRDDENEFDLPLEP